MTLKLFLYRGLCSFLYYSGGLEVIRWHNRRKARVITYHRVGPVDDFVFRAIENLCVPRPVFEKQLAYLKRRYAVVPMAEFLDTFGGSAAAKTAKRLPDHAAVLTFDDGMKDNHLNALPALKEAGLPATFFVLSDATAGVLPDYIAYYFLLTQLGETKMGIKKRAFLALPKAERKRVLLELAGKYNVAWPPGLCRSLFMGGPELKELQAAGYDLQPHSAGHAWLAAVPIEEMRLEISECKAALERTLGNRCVCLAYPFGWKGSYNQAVADELKAQGFQAAFTALDGLNDAHTNRFTLYRINAVGNSLPEFACEVENLRGSLGGILKAVLFWRRKR